MCNRIRWAFLGFCVFWVSLGPGILQPARGAEIITGQYGSVTAVDDTLMLDDGHASSSAPINVGAAGFSPLNVTKLSGPIETTFSLTGLYDTANNPLPAAMFDITGYTFNDPLYTVLTMTLSPTPGECWPSELLPLAEFADTTVTFELIDITLDPNYKWVLGPDAAVKITMSTGGQPPGDGGKRVPTGPAPVPAPDSLVLALAGITLLLCAGWYYRRGHAVRPAG